MTSVLNAFLYIAHMSVWAWAGTMFIPPGGGVVVTMLAWALFMTIGHLLRSITMEAIRPQKAKGHRD